ncbi:MAG: 6,7-dimethyl-8-ribityllumazine synthase [Pseudomonadota bacterium]|nr:6,7-dimethyl-8-ribityllumazine synthase [Pseudomonadota bacterium]
MSFFNPTVSISLKYRSYRIAIVTAEFNFQVTQKLEEGANAALKHHGISAAQISAIRVPGAFEIPLTAKLLFEKGFDGVVAIGCVIRGETTHYESVCTACERGLMDVQLAYHRPIGFGIIMTENLEQALDRCGGKHGNKGIDAAEAMLKILEIKEKINETKSYQHLTQGSFQ